MNLYRGRDPIDYQDPFPRAGYIYMMNNQQKIDEAEPRSQQFLVSETTRYILPVADDIVVSDQIANDVLEQSETMYQ